MYICPECETVSYYIVDGKEMEEQTLLSLKVAPKSIVFSTNHKLWCTRFVN